MGGDKSSFEVTPWTAYRAEIVLKHSQDRLVAFKPLKTSALIGCIRVREKDNTTIKLWDIVDKDGQFIGLVPAGCEFEAMLVYAKMIIPK
jgi:translation initiation factor IF-1